MKNYKILFADLDGTLIKTKSGETFPKGIWDMEIRFDVLSAIKEINPQVICIVSNQGGIEKGFINKDSFESKLKYLRWAIKEYTGAKLVYGKYCSSNREGDYYRKPNLGMLKECCNDINTWFSSEITVRKEDCLMIGDASGKVGQYSDTDKKTAENFGIDYMDVNDFVEQINLED